MRKKLVLFLLVNAYAIPSQENYWTETYQKATQGFWGTYESLSGPGSDLEQTAIIRKNLEDIIKKYNITSIVDLPCGDFYWMNFVDFGTANYIGCDIVKPLIQENIKKYKNKNRQFLQINVTQEEIPQVDLIFCRDLLVHLSLPDIMAALHNFKRSGAKYLLTTTFTTYRPNTNSVIESGGWRPIDLERFPFNFPAPLLLINEQCTEQNGIYGDKSLGLWLLDDIVI